MHRDKIKDDFLAAIQRIETGAPNNLELQKRAKAGSLRLNAFTVAIESGHSRTLIAQTDSQYPEVRDKIYPEKRAAPVGSQSLRPVKAPTSQMQITRLRGEKRHAIYAEKLIATQLFEIQIVNEKLKKEILTLKEKVKRLER